MTNKAAWQQAPLMGPDEAKQAMDSGKALFVDVRRPDQFERLRIPGAVSIPIRGSVDRLFDLPENLPVILY